MVNKFSADSAYYQTISTPPQSDNEEDFPTTAQMEMEQDQADEFGPVGGPRISDNFFGNKDFELLTEAEKKTLPKHILARKEAEYQRKLVAQLPVYYPGLSGCRKMAEEYQYLNDIAEGTYGQVFRAQNKRTDEIVALKLLKLTGENKGFPISALREVNMLLKCGQHPNVVNVREVVVDGLVEDGNWAVCLVMEYMEQDLKSLMDKMKAGGKRWTIAQLKTLMQHLLSGINHLHGEFVIHRDLKTANLLLSNQGILKIGDFGMAREFGDPLKPYSPLVCTLWYRAPEMLLGQKLYSTPVDIWSVGCIFAELLRMEPLFPGRGELEQMKRIFKCLGVPNEQNWPGSSQLAGMQRANFDDILAKGNEQFFEEFGEELGDSDGFELLKRLLELDPAKRISAEEALRSGWFQNEPKPAHPSTFPTWPSRGSEQKRKKRQQSQQQVVDGFTLKFDVPKF